MMSPAKAGGMTGPEHYRKAEQILEEEIVPIGLGKGFYAEGSTASLIAGLTHALLANAAAIATQNEPADGAIREGWLMVVGP